MLTINYTIHYRPAGDKPVTVTDRQTIEAIENELRTCGHYCHLTEVKAPLYLPSVGITITSVIDQPTRTACGCFHCEEARRLREEQAQ